MPNAQDIGSDFHAQHPSDTFDKGTRWTRQGSAERLRENVLTVVEFCLRNNPQKATIQFEKMPDGGYEIRHAKKKV